jgi:hypothetical protein
MFLRKDAPMAELIDQPATETTPEARPEAPPETDLVAAIRGVLEASTEPLTISKIRAALPGRLRTAGLEDVLRRQVAANVFVQYPKYRSPQDRFWDRPMAVHLAALLHAAVQEKPLTWSDLRRKLPDYARSLAEPVLEEQVARGELHRHPALNSRTGPRFGGGRPDPKEYLRTELLRLFERLGQLGFSPAQLREGALDLLHEEEWASQSRTAQDPAESRGPKASNLDPVTSAAATGEPALFAQADSPTPESPPPQP